MDCLARVAVGHQGCIQLLQTLGHTRAPKQQWDWHLPVQQGRITQGDPLSMFAYGIGILPLSICLLKVKIPAVEQPWYADDAGAGRKFAEICHFFSKLQDIGPNFGYYPEPTTSILVVPQHNLEAAQVTFPDFNFKVTTGS
jgi:hypothetical protein